MKKFLIVFTMLLLLTGCNARYEFSINNGKFKEKLNLVETNKALFDVQNDTGWTLRDLFDPSIYYDEFSSEDYKIKSLNDEDHLELQYSSNSLASAINSTILNQCYNNPTVVERDNIVTIETGNDFDCYEYYDNLEKIQVRFRTNHKIISTNSDLVENDVYIWNISKDSNKNIIITYDNSITYDKYKGIIIVGVIVLILGLGIVTYLIIKKIKKENKI